ncbi:DNA-directed RNA polymerase subunit beta' [Candidatus Saccharibacteria bacterium]|nr:DNA-directed RNA polymerase subunit beta' [Candidatus Saccharibacteria bacterium]MBQ6605668.1 DNA-directed RNA polymerase subunit beta' [Candidatus Saccharibacteria bacterium]
MAWMDNFISASDFDSIRLSVASADDILNWSYGEVLKPETINYRTQKPERDGLFCERIFGPVKDINPHDAKLKGVRSREAAVDKEGNLVTKSISRRERMGHISLAAPVTHIWFMKGTPSALSILLDLTVKNIEKVVYFATYLIIDAKDEAIEKTLADLEAQTETARQAIKMRYEKDGEKEGADVKVLAEGQTKELEELEADFLMRKKYLEGFKKGAVITEVDYRNMPEEYEELITVKMGAEAIKKLLDEIDLDLLINELKEEYSTAKGQKAKKISKRLKTLEGMQAAGIKPNDLVLTVIPVIPPDLRPMISLPGGRFATSDLNDLYRRVINRNNRLKKLLDLNAPEVICRNEKRMLQEAVDALIDNSASHGGRTAASQNGRRKLKSLSDLLKGKQGRFRQNLLGKRVDYSGRSVIVVGPELKLNECGLPKQMALELFKPFVISWLIGNEYANNIRVATRMIEAGEAVVWDALDDVIQGKYVLLNRAPSLHRLSVQAFQPKLIDGKAIQLHPLVASGFNADYDGDQMAVHLPLSSDAQAEARELMSATKNLLKPADGAPVLAIYQDVVLGIYYLTYDKPGTDTDDVKAFSSIYEAEMAYDKGLIALQTPIRVFAKKEIRNTTLGRVIFNEILPKDYPFDNSVQTSKQLKKVMANIFDIYGPEVTVKTADAVKNLAFEYETIASVSTAKDDYPTYPEIADFVAEGDAKTALIQDQFNQGLVTEEERRNLTVANWRDIDKKISDFLKEKLSSLDTDIAVMVNSGARGSVSNIKLASAEIGIMVDINNNEIELPVKSSYKEGLNTLESFIATRGARQGQVSTALRTADSGYLTRRLVDVAQDVFTTDEEAFDPGFTVYKRETEITGINFAQRISGRFTAEAIPGYLEADQLITPELAAQIEADDKIESVKIQSVLTTTATSGVPRKAYGVDMSTRELVEANQPVGVIAAQSLGEPGTQLTLDTKHGSGVAGSGAIARGLPRVEELLEARSPKGQAWISPVDGVCEVWEDNNHFVVQITPQSGETTRIELEGRKAKVKDGASVKTGDVIASKPKGAEPLIAPFDGNAQLVDGAIILVAAANSPVRVEIPGSAELVVKSNDSVKAGDRLTTGSLNLQDLLKYKGAEETERYIMNDVMSVYAAQGHEISAKHFEVIIRQMFNRVQITEPGDSSFVSGDIVSRAAVEDENKELEKDGKEKASFDNLLLGITKVSIWSDSFLSAASFQDTTRVLINAAINGRVDHLHGLKENVIIGRKIPVGTGVHPIISTPEVDSLEPTEADLAGM